MNRMMRVELDVAYGYKMDADLLRAEAAAWKARGGQVMAAGKTLPTRLVPDDPDKPGVYLDIDIDDELGPPATTGMFAVLAGERS